MAGWLAGERRRERPTHSHTTSLNKSPKTLFRRRRKRRRIHCMIYRIQLLLGQSNTTLNSQLSTQQVQNLVAFDYATATSRRESLFL